MEHVGLLSIEQGLRRALTTPRQRAGITDALGWDDSQVSRFLSGQQGIPIEKLDVTIKALGYVPVTPEYLNAMAVMCRVGANCECARSGAGECGRGER